MAVLLEAFPKMSRDLLVKIGYSSSVFDFSYTYHGEERELTASTADTSTSKAAVLQLTDQTCHWHPETENLIVRSRLIINVPFFLFGANGLTPLNGGSLGLAIMWMAPDASQRGVTPIGEFTSDSQAPLEISGEIRFPAHILRGTLILQTVLYLKKAGIPQGREFYLAKQPGTVLGIMDETRVIIDGNGSLFPIHEVHIPGEPLWYVRCDWTDPTEDSFSDDNFCLCLNNAHKDFPSLTVNEGLKNSPLLLEILCSSLQILIMKVLDDETAKDATIKGTNLQEGSISSMVNYLLHTFDINYDSGTPESLAINIRKAMMKAI